LVVLIQKMAWRRLAELRGDKTVVLPIGRDARSRRKKEGGDDYRFCHDSLANDDPNGAEIAMLCLGFKRPTRSNVVETRLSFPANAASWPKRLDIATVDKPGPGDETSRASDSGTLQFQDRQ
jgi:hypothetical protein